jgi:hypothetical protein
MEELMGGIKRTHMGVAVLLCGGLQIRWEGNVQNGVCDIQFDRPDIPMNKFVVCCLEAQFHVFDARTQHPREVSVGGWGWSESFSVEFLVATLGLAPTQTHSEIKAHQALHPGLNETTSH